MNTSFHENGNLEELREYVKRTLSQFDDLEKDAFQMSESLVVRNGQPCGIYFCLHGPRSVKYFALWEREKNSIFFYSPDGERFLKTSFSAMPQVESAARKLAVA